MSDVKMTKEEFVKHCKDSGYTTRKGAELYAKVSGKEEFTEEDFIEVYRQVERAMEIAKRENKYMSRGKYKSTKRYQQSSKMGSDKL